MKTALLLLLLPFSAHAAFICDGRKLVTNEGGLYNFPSDQQCQEALKVAANGFTCDGRKLITQAGYSYNFASDQRCADAVRDSK